MAVHSRNASFRPAASRGDSPLKSMLIVVQNGAKHAMKWSVLTLYRAWGSLRLALLSHTARCIVMYDMPYCPAQRAASFCATCRIVTFQRLHDAKLCLSRAGKMGEYFLIGTANGPKTKCVDVQRRTACSDLRPALFGITCFPEAFDDE